MTKTLAGVDLELGSKRLNVAKVRGGFDGILWLVRIEWENAGRTEKRG
jgi:hypothetical protein